jgi:hypothetical protein
MTQRELDDKMYEMRSFIADKFRDIQMQSQSLKNVEDEVKVLQTLTKINDFTDEIRRGYGELDALYHEDVDEEEKEQFDSILDSFA